RRVGPPEDRRAGPRRRTGRRPRGRLGRAELSWAWDLSSALVRDVRLAIDGVRVSLTLEDRDGAAPGSSDAGDDHAGAGHLTRPVGAG
ncbi:hypothetical protein THAOC_11706, partial [Thalassiosira oceanica]